MGREKHKYTKKEETLILSDQYTNSEKAKMIGVSQRSIEHKKSRLLEQKKIKNTKAYKEKKGKYHAYSKEDDILILDENYTNFEKALKLGVTSNSVAHRKLKLAEQGITLDSLLADISKPTISDQKEQHDASKEEKCYFCNNWSTIGQRNLFEDCLHFVCPDCHKKIIEIINSNFLTLDSKGVLQVRNPIRPTSDNAPNASDITQFNDYYEEETLSSLGYIGSYERKFDYTLYIYCSFDNIKSKGCYGYVIVDHNTKKVKRYIKAYDSTTHHRLSLMATTRALTRLENEYKDKCIAIRSNSNYIYNIINKIWTANSNKFWWNKLNNQLREVKRAELYWDKNARYDEMYARIMELCETTLKNATTVYEEDLSFIPLKRDENTLENDKTEENKEEKPLDIASMRILLSKNLDYKDRQVDVSQFYEEIGINKSCASKIESFKKLKYHSTEDYQKLTTAGHDEVSDITLDYFKDYYPLIVLDTFEQNIDNDSTRLEAMRWHYRGLSMEDSIKKALIDESL